MERLSVLKMFQSFDQITTLTDVLMDNFCPCLSNIVKKMTTNPLAYDVNKECKFFYILQLQKNYLDYEILAEINSTYIY